MPDSNGVYTLPPSYLAVSGQSVRTEQHNPPLEDLAAAQNRRLMRNGQTPMIGNLPMGGNRITGLSAGVADSDAARMDQLPAAVSAWVLAVSALNMAANSMPYATGPTTAALATLTAFARSLLDDPDAASARATLGLGTLATLSPSGTANANNFLRGDGAWAAPTSFGSGQNWQIVTGARSMSTTYTNSTALPIMVAIHVFTSGGTADVVVNGGQIMTFQLPGDNRYSFTFVVPPGGTYRVNGTAVLQSWSEFR